MKNIYLSIICAMAIGLFACKKDSNAEAKRTVEYSIACSDCYVVCYDENGQEKSYYNQNSNWKYTMEAQAGDVVLLVAHNTSNGYATVGATIKLNGEVIKTAQSYCPISGTVLVTDTLP